jgi:hypothetical protein
MSLFEGRWQMADGFYEGEVMKKGRGQKKILFLNFEL